MTHAHPDHIWGLVDELDDSLRFPRAEYLVSAREFDFWTWGEGANLKGPIEGIAAGARRVFKAIEARTTRIKPGDEVAAGIAAIDTAGHTPGHISLLMASGSDKLLITADAVQNAHVSFAHPDWQPRADMDGAKAAGSRRHLLDMAATDKLQVLSYHIPFPGLGRVERTDRHSRGWPASETCGLRTSAATCLKWAQHPEPVQDLPCPRRRNSSPSCQSRTRTGASCWRVERTRWTPRSWRC